MCVFAPPAFRVAHAPWRMAFLLLQSQQLELSLVSLCVLLLLSLSLSGSDPPASLS